MGDEKVDNNQADPAGGDPQPTGSDEFGAMETPASESSGTEPADELSAQVSAQIEALKDQVLRSQAEAENTRRRAARDVENAHKFALEKFAGELLPVIDSLEKALEAASGASPEEADAISEGVGLSLKLFLDVLEKSGISQVDPIGLPFDPRLHEAMAMVESPDAEPGSVIDVMQKGYTLNGRLIRAAMVVVSKEPAGGG